MTPNDEKRLGHVAAILREAVTKAYHLIRDTDHAEVQPTRFNLETMIHVVTVEVVAEDWLDDDGCVYLDHLPKTPQVAK